MNGWDIPAASPNKKELRGQYNHAQRCVCCCCYCSTQHSRLSRSPTKVCLKGQHLPQVCQTSRCVSLVESFQVTKIPASFRPLVRSKLVTCSTFSSYSGRKAWHVADSVDRCETMECLSLLIVCLIYNVVIWTTSPAYLGSWHLFSAMVDSYNISHMDGINHVTVYPNIFFGENWPSQWSSVHHLEAR